MALSARTISAKGAPTRTTARSNPAAAPIMAPTAAKWANPTTPPMIGRARRTMTRTGIMRLQPSLSAKVPAVARKVGYPKAVLKALRAACICQPRKSGCWIQANFRLGRRAAPAGRQTRITVNLRNKPHFNADCRFGYGLPRPTHSDCHNFLEKLSSKPDRKL